MDPAITHRRRFQGVTMCVDEHTRLTQGGASKHTYGLLRGATLYCRVVLPAIDHPLVDGDVSVRTSQPADVETLIAGRDAEFYRYLGQGSPDPRPAGCICVLDSVVGWIDYDRDDRAWLAADEVNVGYNIFSQYRGNGYGTWALRLLREHLSSLEPPYRATLLIDPTNLASLALARRAGFEEVPRVEGQVFMK